MGWANDCGGWVGARVIWWVLSLVWVTGLVSKLRGRGSSALERGSLLSPFWVLLVGSCYILVIRKDPSFPVVAVETYVPIKSGISGVGLEVKVIPEALGNLVKFSRVL